MAQFLALYLKVGYSSRQTLNQFKGMTIKSKITFKGVSKSSRPDRDHAQRLCSCVGHAKIDQTSCNINQTFQSPKLYLQAEQEPASSDIFFSRDAVDWYNQLCHIWWHPYQQKPLTFPDAERGEACFLNRRCDAIDEMLRCTHTKTVREIWSVDISH